MKTTIRPYEDKYRGVTYGDNINKPFLTLGYKETISGWFWNRKVECEDVWLVMSTKEEMSYAGYDVEIDHYFTILKSFVHKEDAVDFLNNLIGDI